MSSTGNNFLFTKFKNSVNCSLVEKNSTSRLSTLISLINVEVGIKVEGGIFWKKLVHNPNKRGVEGGKI